jgi:hypothetical protein
MFGCLHTGSLHKSYFHQGGTTVRNVPHSKPQGVFSCRVPWFFFLRR